MSTTTPFLEIFEEEETSLEDPEFYSRQLITYIGNKRSLAKHLEVAIKEVRERLGERQIQSLDLFSGSGFVARLLKKHSSLIMANDLEVYSRIANECFLSNRDETVLDEVRTTVARLNRQADAGEARPGFIREMYSPVDDRDIQLGERAFYTNDNARRLDFFAQEVAELSDPVRTLVMGPLLSAASVHANTSGVFKGFYKDKESGIGKFGGSAGDALKRILDPIRLQVPVLSRVDAESEVFQQDANELLGKLPQLDLIYVDPPYNQHPYGSNYFMLNLIAEYKRPESVSPVSGIPDNWNRSGYNVRKQSLDLLADLFERANARFVLVSFNGEGYVSTNDLRGAMELHGRVDEIVVPYNTFRGSRNLKDRSIHVNEHLLLLDREG